MLQEFKARRKEEGKCVLKSMGKTEATRTSGIPKTNLQVYGVDLVEADSCDSLGQEVKVSYNL